MQGDIYICHVLQHYIPPFIGKMTINTIDGKWEGYTLPSEPEGPISTH